MKRLRARSISLTSAGFLHERLKALIDLAVEMYNSVVVGLYRRSETAQNEDLLRRGPSINEKLMMFGTLAEVLLDRKIPTQLFAAQYLREFHKMSSDVHWLTPKQLLRPKDYNCFDYLERRYNYVRTFFPRFPGVEA